jgi:hypothetical protein
MTGKPGKKTVLIMAGALVTLFATCAACLGVLAFISYQTTQLYWDGGFPTGEFHLRIADEDGMPIEGACLDVYTESGNPAPEYPLYEYNGPGTLCSGPVGDITAHQPEGGFQFGGHEWYLFWFIPIGVDDGPEYDIEISAEGYQTHTMGIWDLFDTANVIDGPMTTFDWMGMEVEMEVYEIEIILEREAD